MVELLGGLFLLMISLPFQLRIESKFPLYLWMFTWESILIDDSGSKPVILH